MSRAYSEIMVDVAKAERDGAKAAAAFWKLEAQARAITHPEEQLAWSSLAGGDFFGGMFGKDFGDFFK